MMLQKNSISQEDHIPLVTRISRDYPLEWRRQSRRLRESVHTARFPNGFTRIQQEDTDRRLRQLIFWVDDHLAVPFRVVQEDLYLRQVTVMDSWRYTVDYQQQSVTWNEFADGTWQDNPWGGVELMRPLKTGYWLGVILENIDPEWKELYFDQSMPAEDWNAMYAWLCDTGYALLQRDPRFQLMREDLHRALKLDPVLLELTQRCDSPDNLCASGVYTLVWQHETGMRRVADICPQVLPLLSAFLQGRKQYDWQEYPFASFRRTLTTEYKLAPVTWVYLVQHGSGIFDVLWQMGRGRDRFRAAIGLLRLLQQAWLPPLPPADILRAFIRVHGDSVLNLDERCRIPRAVIRIVFQQAHCHRRSLPAGFIDDFLLICYWAHDTNPVLDKTGRRAGWPYLLHRAREWECREMELAKTGNISWQSALSEDITFEGRKLVSLNTAGALLEEGMAMRHCVARYLQECINGKKRFFSLRDEHTGKRLATMAIVPDKDTGWCLYDARGFANRHVDEEVLVLGHCLAEEYSQQDDLQDADDEQVAA